jgi:probable HAF family extracellular repeat protein
MEQQKRFWNAPRGLPTCFLSLFMAGGPACSQTTITATASPDATIFGLHFGKWTAKQRWMVYAVCLVLFLPQLVLSDSFSFTFVSEPGALGTSLLGINDHGEIVGESQNQEGTTASFLYENGTFSAVAAPDSTQTFATGINNRGTIVGAYLPTVTTGQTEYGFIDSGGVFKTLDVPSSATTAAIKISSHGEIVGWYGVNNTPFGYLGGGGLSSPFVYNKGSYKTIPIPGGYPGSASGVNNHAQVVGSYNSSLSCPAGTNSCALPSSGFLYQDGQLTTIDFPGAANTALSAINDHGEIVGGFENDINTAGMPFIYLDGTFTRLDVPGAMVAGATDVNEQGVIVGNAVLAGGEHVGFIATPVDGPATASEQPDGDPTADTPEPGNLALMSLGMSVLGMMCFFRRRMTKPPLAD